VEGEPAAIVVCHCVECQRRTGSAFGACAFYDAGAVHPAGASRIYARTSEAGRKLHFRFCPDCGSTVWWETERHPGKIAIAVGAFADPEMPRPVRSVFERTRHHWFDLPGDIAGHVAGSDSAPIER